jgi:single-strand DNA-binding protein
MSLNAVALMGRLVRDPEYKVLADGTSLCNFTLAVDDDYKDKDGNKVTDFIDCTAWKQTAEYVTKYLTKGSLASVHGRLKSRKWEDKDGNKRTSWFVKCDNVYGAGSRNDQNQGSFQQSGSAQNSFPSSKPIFADTDYAALTDDDPQLPF